MTHSSVISSRIGFPFRPHRPANRHFNRLCWLVFGVLLATFVPLDRGGTAFGSEEVGIQVPDGFEVSLYADDDLAHDIYTMTTDSLGRVVVSGPGYVRILVDDNGARLANVEVIVLVLLEATPSCGMAATASSTAVSAALSLRYQ